MNYADRQERGPGGAIAAILAIMAVGLVAAAALAKQRSREDQGASGSGEGSERLDGSAPAPAAISEFKMPADMSAVIPDPPSYAPA
jgi:hypothetical protein